MAEPCDPRCQCTNLQPGYRCEPCPSGFTDGSGGNNKAGVVQGVGLEFARTHKQQCYELNECNDGRNGGCVPNSECVNTDGSFYCGDCLSGYVGNQSVGCHLSPGSCPDGTVCDRNAECFFAGGRSYRYVFTVSLKCKNAGRF